jgi:hypothetical protein
VELDSSLKSIIVYQPTPTVTGHWIVFIIAFTTEIISLAVVA